MPKFNNRKYNKLRKETELKFKGIKYVHNPALNANIEFTSDGFHHLRYDGCRKERRKKTQMHKFRCFDDAVKIIKRTTTIQEYRRSICPIGKPDKSGLRRTKTVEWFAFWAITNFSKKIRVKVVIRRIGGDAGKYHFWSVMPYWNVCGRNKIIGSKEIEDG